MADEHGKKYQKARNMVRKLAGLNRLVSGPRTGGDLGRDPEEFQVHPGWLFQAERTGNNAESRKRPGD